MTFCVRGRSTSWVSCAARVLPASLTLKLCLCLLCVLLAVGFSGIVRTSRLSGPRLGAVRLQGAVLCVVGSGSSTMAFTFAAFCYMLSLVLCAALIFFAIWHVSNLQPASNSHLPPKPLCPPCPSPLLISPALYTLQA